MYGRVYYIFIDGDWLGVSVAMHAKMVAGNDGFWFGLVLGFVC